MTVETNGKEIDFEILRKEYLYAKENSLNPGNGLGGGEKRFEHLQRPFETAQQKAAKRANKLLDSKRQQEIERIAAEKLGNHEKKCPICEHPFKDVNEFMSHLSKCNVIESSEEEQKVKRLREKRQKLDKSINDEIGDQEPKDGLEIYKGDLHPSDDDNTIKVFHFDHTYEKRTWSWDLKCYFAIL